MSNIQLHGFNNLTKNLIISLYKVDHLDLTSDAPFQDYQNIIKQSYNAEILAESLDALTQVIGAQVLNRSTQNYQPHGASVTYMIADSDVPISLINHLNKSHICAHTYPETHPQKNVAIFRLDIDISTCGVISPLKVLNYLLKTLKWDVLTLDYKIRGFTRDIVGKKHYKDDVFDNITDYISDEILATVEMVNHNQRDILNYHSRLMKNNESDTIKDVKEDEGIIEKALRDEKEALFNAYLNLR